MKKILLSLIFITSIFQSQAQWSGVTPIVTTSPTTTKTAPASIDDGNGNMILAWIDARNSATTGNDIYIQKINSDGTKPWGAEKLVCDATGSQSNVYLATDNAGGAIITWQDPRNSATTLDDIYAQRVNASGAMQWVANGVAVTNAANIQTTAIAVAINTTEAVIFWRDSRGTTSDPYANKILMSTGATQWVADVQLSDAASTQTNFAILPDGSDGVFLIWEDPTGTPTVTTDRDIFGQRLNNLGVKQWATSSSIGLSLTPVAGIQQTPSICSDGSGGFVAIFADQRTGTNGGGDIYAQRYNSAGSKVWASDVQVVNAAGFQSNPLIVKSGSELVATWSDPRAATSNRNIYAQQLNIATGALQWTPSGGGVALDGIPIVTSTGHQPASSTTSGLVITADGAGGAYMVWDDARGTFNAIYAQKINNNASLSFTTDGALVASSAVGNQRTPLLINHPTNGIIVAWLSSATSTNGEILAANLKTDGTLPVTFTKITATVNTNQSVLVKWYISSEINTEKYEVERASENGVFVKIGAIKASNLKEYQFTDGIALKGDNYYRIKAIDFDGTISLSEIASAKLVSLSSFEFITYPNPTSENLFISLKEETAINQIYEIRIIDLNGAVKSKISFKPIDGIFKLNTSNLTGGTYIIQIIDSNGETKGVKNFIKL